MTGIKIFYRNNLITGIEAKNHSGYASAGNDIICAAVSALMQALLFGLNEVAGIDIKNFDEYIVNPDIPIIKVVWPEKICNDDRILILVKTIAGALKIIASENSGYIKITEVNL